MAYVRSVAEIYPYAYSGGDGDISYPPLHLSLLEEASQWRLVIFSFGEATNSQPPSRLADGNLPPGGP